MTPLRSVSAGLVLLASLAAPAAASGWTGWPEFYRSFAVEPTPVRPVKLPGIHKVPDVTLKRGVIDTTPKANVAPKPKSSLDAAPPAPSVPGWDSKQKKGLVGAAPPVPGATMTAIALTESRGDGATYRGVQLQQGWVPLDDLPAPRPLAAPAPGRAAPDGRSYATGHFAMDIDGVKSPPRPTRQKFTLFQPSGKPVR